MLRQITHIILLVMISSIHLSYARQTNQTISAGKDKVHTICGRHIFVNNHSTRDSLSIEEIGFKKVEDAFVFSTFGRWTVFANTTKTLRVGENHNIRVINNGTQSINYTLKNYDNCDCIPNSCRNM